MKKIISGNYFLFAVWFMAITTIVLLFLYKIGIKIPIIGFSHDWGGDLLFRSQIRSFFSYEVFSKIGGVKSIDTALLINIFTTPLRLLPLPIANLILLIAITLIGLHSFYLLLKTHRISILFCIVGAIFYIASPVFFDRLYLSYYYSLIAFALFPYLIILTEKLARDQYRVRDIVIVSLLLAIIYSQIHYGLFASFYMFMMVIIAKDKKSYFLKFAFIQMIIILLNLQWLMPALTGKTGISVISSSATVVEWVASRSENLVKLLAFQHPNKIFYSTYWWPRLSVILLAILWLAPWLYKKTREEKILLTMGILMIFSASLLQQPNLSFVQSLFKLTIVRIFREPAHLIGASYIFLFPLIIKGIDLIYCRMAKRNKYLYVFIIFILAVIVSQPFWSGRAFKEIAIDNLSRYENLKLDRNKKRTFFVPSIGPYLKYGVDDINKSINNNPAVELLPNRQSFPTEGGRLFYGGAVTNYRNLIIWLIANNRIEEAKDVIKRANVAEIIYDKHWRSKYRDVTNLGDYQNISQRLEINVSQIEALGFKKILDNKEITIFEKSGIQTEWSAVNNLIITNNPAFKTNADWIIQNDWQASDYLDKADKFYDANQGWTRGSYWFWYDDTFPWLNGNLLLTKKNGAVYETSCKRDCRVLLWLNEEGGSLSINNVKYETKLTRSSWVQVSKFKAGSKLQIENLKGSNAFSIVNDIEEIYVDNNISIEEQNDSNLIIKGSGYVMNNWRSVPNYFLKSNTGHIAKPYIINGIQTAFYLDESKGTFWKIVEPVKKTHFYGLIGFAIGSVMMMLFLLVTIKNKG